MSSSYHVYIGNIIRIRRELIPSSEKACKCNGKIPQSKHCPECGKAKQVELDTELIDNLVVEPIYGISHPVIFLRTIGITHHIDCYGNDDLVEAAMPQKAIQRREELPEEIKRILSLGGEYCPTQVIVVHSY